MFCDIIRSDFIHLRRAIRVEVIDFNYSVAQAYLHKILWKEDD